MGNRESYRQLHPRRVALQRASTRRVSGRSREPVDLEPVPPSHTTGQSGLNHLNHALNERRLLVGAGFIEGREKPNGDGFHSTHVGVGIGTDQHPDEVDDEVASPERMVMRRTHMEATASGDSGDNGFLWKIWSRRKSPRWT